MRLFSGSLNQVVCVVEVSATATPPGSDAAYEPGIGDHDEGQRVGVAVKVGVGVFVGVEVTVGVGVAVPVGWGEGVRVAVGVGIPAHTPALQVWVDLQAAQRAPLLPQAALVEPRRQVVPSQQPGQLAAVQVAFALAVQTPLTQAIRVQQLALVAQGDPDFAHPPSHFPPMQEPEQHCAPAVQAIRLGLQRHTPLPQ